MVISIAFDEEFDIRGFILDRADWGPGSEIHNIPCGLVLSLFTFCTDVPYNHSTTSPSEFQRKLQ